ncbi:efflux RND transporter periplasmic adaptor subunit [Shumkonia mesophila]|uniref:efflux RND transporter periplasmic adaptor subunit n=1 Tax=Shumkonia mesophila TaxID=2838854 RepID=UPI002934732F|nr:efflux RND transporter periplasmic adaptor subunit [Shumkonia mesophila]
MKKVHSHYVLWGAAAMLAAVVGGFATLPYLPGHDAKATEAVEAAPPPAVPVSVATVERRDIVPWEEFSGRLEAVERVEVRSRVAGQIQALHFREGGLVKQGDLLVTIDPAPFAAEVARAEAQTASARARLAFTKREYERARELSGSGTIPLRELDSRTNAYAEAQSSLRAAQAALETAKLNLGYTQIRAAVSGRVGKAEVTVGNLVAAGAGAPVLTTLVSVDPIYASFDADEQVVMRALSSLRDGAGGALAVERVPVRMEAPTADGAAVPGRVQMIDNVVDAGSGTVRVRAVFDNGEGVLMPGQFVRLRMGQAKSEPVLLISERAVGTDQDKKFVMVVGEDNKAAYREISLGATAGGLRVVADGLKAGERIVVNGLQRLRPGALVAPKEVSMAPTRLKAVAQR